MFLTRCNRQYAERLRDEIRDFLRETCGLELSAEKTRITHVRDGYDFLGFNISIGVGKSGKLVPKVKVGRKAITNIQLRLGEALRYRPMQESISVRLARGSDSHSWLVELLQALPTTSRKLLIGLDHKAFWIAVKAICRKADISTAKCLRKYSFRTPFGVHETCTLARFCDTAPAFYYVAPEPYQPGVNQPLPGRRRSGKQLSSSTSVSGPGCGDLKWKALVRDGFHCRGCAVAVTSKTSHADHIEPVNRFANLEMANGLDNIQTLMSALPQAQN